MDNAVEQLLKDHKMIRKVLGDWEPGVPRFTALLKTLRRIVLGHAWFEDEFLLPALKTKPQVFRPFWTEIAQEHEDIAALLNVVRDERDGETLRGYAKTLKSLLATHFAKEEDALFPLALKVITQEGLVEMAAEMERRKTEARERIV